MPLSAAAGSDVFSTHHASAAAADRCETERGEEYAELLNAIAALDNPKALTLAQLMEKAPALEWLHDKHRRRFIRHRLEECGYIVVPNPDAVDRLWYANKKRQVIYTQSDLP